jgi:hypothetical protein
MDLVHVLPGAGKGWDGINDQMRGLKTLAIDQVHVHSGDG